MILTAGGPTRQVVPRPTREVVRGHRLAVLRHAEEVTGNIARTCRYYGISRPTFYKWLRRYQDEGLAGLRDRSSATHADIVNKIVYLRQNYHFGPVKIQMYLEAVPRHHDH